MRKWQTVVLALLPMLLLVVLMNVDFESFGLGAKYDEAILALAEAESMSYVLTLPLDYDNEDGSYRITDRVKVTIAPELQEYHATDLRLDSTNGEFEDHLEYYEVPGRYEGVILKRQQIDDWVQVESRSYGIIYLPVVVRLQEILSNYVPKSQPYKEDETYVVFRVYEDQEDAEAIIALSLKRLGNQAVIPHNIYEDVYYVDVAIDKATAQVVGIDLLNSSIGKAIGCYNGFFNRELVGVETPQYEQSLKDVDYKVSHISTQSQALQLPVFITMDEFMEQQKVEALANRPVYTTIDAQALEKIKRAHGYGNATILTKETGAFKVALYEKVGRNEFLLLTLDKYLGVTHQAVVEVPDLDGYMFYVVSERNWMNDRLALVRYQQASDVTYKTEICTLNKDNLQDLRSVHAFVEQSVTKGVLHLWMDESIKQIGGWLLYRIEDQHWIMKDLDNDTTYSLGVADDPSISFTEDHFIGVEGEHQIYLMTGVTVEGPVMISFDEKSREVESTEMLYMSAIRKQMTDYKEDEEALLLGWAVDKHYHTENYPHVVNSVHVSASRVTEDGLEILGTVLRHSYTSYNQVLKLFSGSNIPIKVVVEVDDGHKPTLISYEEAKDGGSYVSSIREMAKEYKDSVAEELIDTQHNMEERQSMLWIKLFNQMNEEDDYYRIIDDLREVIYDDEILDD